MCVWGVGGGVCVGGGGCLGPASVAGSKHACLGLSEHDVSGLQHMRGYRPAPVGVPAAHASCSPHPCPSLHPCPVLPLTSAVCLHYHYLSQEADAARAYDRALVRLRGRAAATNFGHGGYGGDVVAWEEMQARLLRGCTRCDGHGRVGGGELPCGENGGKVLLRSGGGGGGRATLRILLRGPSALRFLEPASAESSPTRGPCMLQCVRPAGLPTCRASTSFWRSG